jgi:hypothetical protein
MAEEDLVILRVDGGRLGDLGNSRWSGSRLSGGIVGKTQWWKLRDI